MALALKQPRNIVEDMGTDDFIRDLREMWIKYASPKYIDLIDTDFNPTPEEEMINPDLHIVLPEITFLRPLIIEDEAQ